MKLSVCVIAGNEEKNIEKCLRSLTGFGFELVVVDTGATDRTREIALRYTSSVYDFPWCDDFAAARNFALEKAENPYILMIDCDECLLPPSAESLALLERALSVKRGQAGRIRRKNIMHKNGEEQENLEWINRVFAREEFCYRGRIHEQLVSRKKEDYETFQTELVIMHTGYDLAPEELEQKAQRNIKLLQRELECLEETLGKEGKEGAEQEEARRQLPYLLYQLGKSYYMRKDYNAACAYFGEGLSFDLNPKLEYVIDMVETYGYALLNAGRAKEALSFQNIYDEFGGSADFRILLGLIYMNNEMFAEAVETFLSAAECKNCRMKGADSFLAYYNAGVVREGLGELSEALALYQKCGGYEPAVRGIARIKKQLGASLDEPKHS